MKACFITFGCRLNRAEALDEEAAYLAKGWQLTDDHAEADLFVVRGCSVTSRAQRDCEKTIAHIRAKYPAKRVIVCGCLAQTDVHPAASRLRAAKAAPGAVAPETPVPTRTARAYLKVQDGCSGKCAFCIVPSFRGPSVSVPFDQVVDKARRFIDAGYREIVVTGCNLSLYASAGKRLPETVAALASLSAGCRIRLGSLEPGACASETVDAMASCANVCRFLHIPVQSGSNLILSAMHRPYLVRDVEALVDKAIGLMPNLGLGCDLMTGFPGETEMDFLGTKGLVDRLPFNRAHVFPFSSRPGTAAAANPSSVPKDIRSRRAHELAQLVDEKRAKFAKTFVGKEVSVVIEDEEKQAGWTSEYLWFEYEGTNTRPQHPRKANVTFKVRTATPHRLLG